MPFWFYAFIALCVAFVVLGLWMIAGTESYWRAAHWLVVKNVRDAEPHPFALVGYKVAGVTVIVAAVWLAVSMSQSMIDKKRRTDLTELFGYPEVKVYEPEEGDGEIRAKMAVGPQYFESTPERLDALDGVGDAEFLVAVSPWAEEVSVDEADGQVTVTAWRTCVAATEYLCANSDDVLPPRSTLWVLPIPLTSPLGDRHVVDGATGDKLDRFAGE